MYVTDQVKATTHTWTGDGGVTTATDTSISGLTRMTTYERFSGMVESEAADTFPADGWVGGTHYVKAPATTMFRPMAEYGSYVGTGTYGPNDPVVLNFGIKPYLVYVRAATRSCDGLGDEYRHDQRRELGLNCGLFLRGVTETRLEHLLSLGYDEYTDTSWVYDVAKVLRSTWADYALDFRVAQVKLSGDTYPNNMMKAADQLNEKGETYYYVAIGLAE